MLTHKVIELALAVTAASSTSAYLYAAPPAALLHAVPAIAVTMIYFVEAYSSPHGLSDIEGVIGLTVLHLALAVFGLFFTSDNSGPSQFLHYKKALYIASLAMSCFKFGLLVYRIRRAD